MDPGRSYLHRPLQASRRLNAYYASVRPEEAMYKRAKITRRQFVRQATQGAAALSLSAGPSATSASKRADAILEVTDWQKAAGAGWMFADSQLEPHSGRISV